MTPRERRAYLLGYRPAQARMRRELHAMAADWDTEASEIRDEVRATRAMLRERQIQDAEEQDRPLVFH
jgi:hypothetical protein